MRVDPFKVVRQFEDALAKYTGAPYCVTTTSCTMALLLSLEWMRRKAPAPVVEIPKRTYVGVAMSVVNSGHLIAFRDEDWLGSYRLEPYPVIDAARLTTSGMYETGTLMCLSMHWTKVLGVEQGGAILLDDPDADQWLRKARFDGRTEGMPAHLDTFTDVGWHAYMSPETAAAGLVRLANLPKHNAPLPNSNYPDLSLAPIFCRRPARLVDAAE